MSWERRERGGWYYTRTHKQGGRVIREYIGTGPVAEQVALLDLEAARAKRQAKKASEAELASFDALDGPLGALAMASKHAEALILIAAGYSPKDHVL